MIDTAVEFFSAQMGAYLLRHIPGEEHVAVGSPSSTDPTVQAELANKVVVTLVHLGREPTFANAPPPLRTNDGHSVQAPPPLEVSLNLLLSANYERDYLGSLKMLSLVTQFLHENPIFTRQSAPNLPASLERLSVEWHDVDMESSHKMWRVLGRRYLPSIACRIRMLIVEGERVDEPSVLPITPGDDAIG